MDDDERLINIEREVEELKNQKDKEQDKEWLDKRDRMLKAKHMHFDSNREFWNYINGK